MYQTNLTPAGWKWALLQDDVNLQVGENVNCWYLIIYKFRSPQLALWFLSFGWERRGAERSGMARFSSLLERFPEVQTGVAQGLFLNKKF